MRIFSIFLGFWLFLSPSVLLFAQDSIVLCHKIRKCLCHSGIQENFSNGRWDIIVDGANYRMQLYSEDFQFVAEKPADCPASGQAQPAAAPAAKAQCPEPPPAPQCPEVKCPEPKKPNCPELAPAPQCPEAPPAPAAQTAEAGACGGLPACDSLIRIVGSNTIGAQLMPDLVAEKAKDLNVCRHWDIPEYHALSFKNPDDQQQICVEISARGSSTAFTEMARGQVDIGMASREVRAAEVQNLAAHEISQDLSSADHENVLALDAVVPIVAPNNNWVNDLTLQQLAAMFCGQISHWEQLQHPQKQLTPIQVYALDSNSGTFDTFNALVLKPENCRILSSATRFDSHQELVKAVNSSPNAIGFTTLAEAAAAKPLAVRGACGIAQSPTLFNVKAEDYALSRRLYLYSREASRGSGWTRKILNYAFTPEAEQLIERNKFITQQIIESNAQTHRAYLTAAETCSNWQNFNIPQNAQRLSVTLRFKAGSSELDSKAWQDLRRIATYMRSQKHKRLFLLGYSDADGDFGYNCKLSQERAEMVKMQLSQGYGLDANSIVARGMSEINPVFCNDSPTGKQKNRRVEVWVAR